MCGICAQVPWSSAVDHFEVERINRAQRHRGPDGAVAVVVGNCALGNTRLAIITPGAAGDQPLAAPDGSVTAVFNGEIYNYRELIRDHRLLSHGSDGSVIPQLYARHGTAAFGLLRGMFAIILVDHRLGRVVLARDSLGVKPLHWRRADSAFLVASEIKPLLLPGARPSAEAVGRFLHLGSMPTSSTPFPYVYSVAPNTWVELDRSGAVTEGRVTADPVTESASPVTESNGSAVVEALLESVRLHLRSDVPTALLLSSGLDSSALAWAAARSGQQLHCLTVDLGGGRSESNAAARTAARYGHSHEVVQRPIERDDLPSFFASMQRPSIDGLNTFLVCRAVAQKGYKVALSGLGGDEASAGYRHFRLLRLLGGLAIVDRVPALANLLRRATVLHRGPLAAPKALELIGDPLVRDAWTLSLLQRRVWNATEARRAAGLDHCADVVQEEPVGVSSRSARALSQAEYRIYLQSTLLPDADAFSMASSVELRVPFVDSTFLASALAAGSTRGLGKTGMAACLGEPYLQELARRPKQGFSVPMDLWMRDGPLRPLLDAARALDAPLYDVVDQGIAAAAFDVWESRHTSWSTPWALVVLDQWMRTLI